MNVRGQPHHLLPALSNTANYTQARHRSFSLSYTPTTVPSKIYLVQEFPFGDGPKPEHGHDLHKAQMWIVQKLAPLHQDIWEDCGKIPEALHSLASVLTIYCPNCVFTSLLPCLLNELLLMLYSPTQTSPLSGWLLWLWPPPSLRQKEALPLWASPDLSSCSFHLSSNNY